MADTSDFANAILNNPNLSREITNVKKRALFMVAQGIVTVLLGIALTVQIHLKNSMVLTNKQISDRLSKSVFFTRLNMIASGGILLFNAFSLLFRYKPSNTEVSLAVLIKYLRLEGIIKTDVYEALKKFKPYRVHTLKIDKV